MDPTTPLCRRYLLNTVTPCFVLEGSNRTYSGHLKDFYSLAVILKVYAKDPSDLPTYNK
jgi:hypothetical protein